MTKRECKKIAQKLAEYELSLQSATTEEEKFKIQNKILKLCTSLTDLADMIQVDEEVQNILKNS